MSGLLGSLSSGVSSISNIASSAQNLFGSLGNLFGGGGIETGPPGQWAQSRQKATFAGVPIVIEENSYKRGRQTVLHTYPFRDDPWPEDVGRSPRITSMRGFVVGNNPDQQMMALAAALEKPGPLPLVHPTLGTIQVSVLEASLSDRKEQGRMYGFEITVVPWLVRQYPVVAAAAKSTGFFGSLGASISSTFATVQSTVQQVQSQVTGAIQTVQGYASQASSLVHDVTGLAGLPVALGSALGNVGRFAGGSVTSGTSAFTSVALATSSLNGAFQKVGQIGGTLSSLAAKL